MQDVAREIIELEDENGNVAKLAVVERARDPLSAMHGFFRWDLQKAAENDWLNTAALLIRRIKMEVIVREVSLDVTRFVRDTTTKDQYTNILRVQKNEERSRDTILDEMDRVKKAAKRARNIAAVLGTADHVDEIIRLASIVEKRINPDDPLGPDQPPGGSA
jgi:hypothetical protein